MQPKSALELFEHKQVVYILYGNCITICERDLFFFLNLFGILQQSGHSLVVMIFWGSLAWNGLVTPALNWPTLVEMSMAKSWDQTKHTVVVR